MLPLALFLRHTEFWFFLAWEKDSREGSDTILNWPVAWWWEYSPGKQETWIGIPLLPLGLGHDVTSLSTATSKPLVGLALTERLTVHTSTGMRINQKPPGLLDFTLASAMDHLLFLDRCQNLQEQSGSQEGTYLTLASATHFSRQIKSKLLVFLDTQESCKDSWHFELVFSAPILLYLQKHVFHINAETKTSDKSPVLLQMLNFSNYELPYSHH